MKRLLKLILYSNQKWCNIERKWCDLKEKSRNLEQMWFRAKKKYNFIVLIHIALKDDTARDIVDHNDFVTLSTKKRLKLFQFSYTTWSFRYPCQKAPHSKSFLYVSIFSKKLKSETLRHHINHLYTLQKARVLMSSLEEIYFGKLSPNRTNWYVLSIILVMRELILTIPSIIQ